MISPTESLSFEHELIERMLKLVKDELNRMKDTRNVNAVFINEVVDFMSDFVLGFHTGKEQAVFIKELDRKELSPPHRNTLDELLKEHGWENDVISRLAKDRGKFIQGNNDVIPEMMGLLEDLVDYFPKHLDKEDNRFFNNVLKYFSPDEKKKLAEEVSDFERNFLRNTYATRIAGMEK